MEVQWSTALEKEKRDICTSLPNQTLFKDEGGGRIDQSPINESQSAVFIQFEILKMRRKNFV